VHCYAEDLRAVRPQDLCFFSEEGIMYAQMLEGYLAEQEIPCLLVPVSKAARAALGLSFSTYKIYLPYQHFEDARAVAAVLNPNPTEELRKTLMGNRPAWHVLKKEERRLRKKLKLDKASDLMAAIEAAVLEAVQIMDQGAIDSCFLGGHFLRVDAGDRRFWFNSVTYEVFG
jgi:hypothetical protein